MQLVKLIVRVVVVLALTFVVSTLLTRGLWGWTSPDQEPWQRQATSAELISVTLRWWGCGALAVLTFLVSALLLGRWIKESRSQAALLLIFLAAASGMAYGVLWRTLLVPGEPLTVLGSVFLVLFFGLLVVIGMAPAMLVLIGIADLEARVRRERLARELERYGAPAVFVVFVLESPESD